MATWLLKSEPGTWSWDDQVKRGDKGEHWDGVRNHQAANFMRAMKKGERAFFYHSGDERQIVGIVQVIREFYPDPSDASGKFGMVDVKAITPVPRPVTLTAIKSEPELEDLLLVRNSRLSVVPVSDAHWQMLNRMAGLSNA